MNEIQELKDKVRHLEYVNSRLTDRVNNLLDMLRVARLMVRDLLTDDDVRL